MADKENPRVILSHPTANVFSRHLGLALAAHGMLRDYCTSFHWNPTSIDGLIPDKIKRELYRRVIPHELRPIVRSWPAREIGRILSLKTGLSFLNQHETGIFSVDAVYRSLDHQVARFLSRNPPPDWIYAYEDGALESFEIAQKCGILRAYDLPIAYWDMRNRLMLEEAERLPQWASTMEGILDSEEKLARKTEEIERADLIFCPSKFVDESIPSEIRAEKSIHVIPFGTTSFSDPGEPDHNERRSRSEKLRILFVGSMSQRKGLADVFEAMRMLDRSDIELIVLGTLRAPLSFYRQFGVDFTYEPPRPHEAVLKFMKTCHVFVLPSIVEGRALVMQEAMGAGLPLIITPNTGGEDLIEDGETGFLVPIRNPENISEKINWFADHRDKLTDMSLAARRKAFEFTWEGYGKEIASAMIAYSESRY